MAWGPQGETEYVEREITKVELEAELAKNPSNASLARFIACIQDGDKVCYQSEHNNHRGYERYRIYSQVPYTGDDGETYYRIDSFHCIYSISSFVS